MMLMTWKECAARQRLARRRLLASTLIRCHGSRTATARVLGVTRTYCQRLLADYGVESLRPGFRGWRGARATAKARTRTVA